MAWCVSLHELISENRVAGPATVPHSELVGSPQRALRPPRRKGEGRLRGTVFKSAFLFLGGGARGVYSLFILQKNLNVCYKCYN